MGQPETADRYPPEAPAVQQAAHSTAVEALADVLGSAPCAGLTTAEARRRLAQDGSNELPGHTPETVWRRIGRQFGDLVIWLLIAAGGVSAALGEWVDCAAILVIVLLNAVLGAFQEGRAARALESLRQLSAPRARVLRDGVTQPVPARDLVTGDRVIVEQGDRVPADLRLVATTRCTLDEASLTGESVPVEKDARLVLATETPLADRRNMAYLGSTVATGHAEGLVVATGARTELGAIAGMLREATAAPTPLQQQLARLGRSLIAVCLVLVGVTSAAQLLRGSRPADALFSAIGLAVAAVPEGLPAVVTVALALGVQRMAARHALVRRLPSVETLGCVTVICTDKTGTLTRGSMTVVSAFTSSARYDVTGAGYSPGGQYIRADSGDHQIAIRDPDLRELLAVGASCNHATYIPATADGKPHWEGDPTEVALLVAASKLGISPPASRSRPLAESPFDSDRKMMTIVLADPDGEARRMYAKGAVEALLPRCASELRDGRIVRMTAERRQAHLAHVQQMASEALRVLAMARRDVPRLDSAVEAADARDLTFVGAVGMIDPPREEAADAVAACRRAGVRAVMITGDHPSTAMAIARAVGLDAGGGRVVTGVELDAMTEADLLRRAREVTVYARVTAAHKLRIVRALKSGGAVVAMTGDGVNDAPALKEADIGIAMGLASPDVTKDAADMVLTDDNFATIVAAVEEGRGIFANVRRFVQYLVACNAAEIAVMLTAALAGWPMPLSPVQLLWINLVTDGLPALALGVDPPEQGAMARAPRPRSESILPWSALPRLVLHAGLIAGVTLFAFTFTLSHPGALATSAQAALSAQTAAFFTAALAELAYAVAQRSRQRGAWRASVRRHRQLLAAVATSAGLLLLGELSPVLRTIFGLSTLRAGQWLGLVMLALLPAGAVEMGHFITAHRRRRSARQSALQVAGGDHVTVGQRTADRQAASPRESLHHGVPGQHHP